MRKMKNIFKSRKGETLTETLIGVLIVGMATAIMVAGISSAVSTNRKVKSVKEQNQFNYAATSSSDQTLTIMNEYNTTIDTINVTEKQDGKYVWFEAK